MSAVTLLSRLRRLGVHLRADGERLRFEAPPGVMTDELREELRARKAEILALLRDVVTASRRKAPPIVRVSRDGDLPVSFAQRRLWFLDRLGAGAAYNAGYTVRLRGRLEEDALHRSLDGIVRRHEVLRTSFPATEGHPLQRIASPGPVPLAREDLSGLAPLDREREAQRRVDAERGTPFDLARGPLIRCSLIRLAADDHVLILMMHHIVIDGWSIDILKRDLAAFYAAHVAGTTPSLPELPVQYADYAQWQNDWLQGDVASGLLDFWRSELGAKPTVLALPTDRPRPPVMTYEGAAYEFSLPSELSAALQDLSRQRGVSRAMLLLAAFQTLLNRYTGQEDVIVGSPIANRNRSEIEDLIGFFVNSIVLRTDLSGDPTFTELLDRVRRVSLAAYDHQDLPFEQLVKALASERDISANPLFQVTFVMQGASSDDLALPGLQLERFGHGVVTTHFDLELHVVERSRELNGQFLYNTDLFDAATIERMAGHYRTLLERIVGNPTTRLSCLSLLSERERRRVVVDWNDTAVDLDTDRCLHELFRAQVQRSPDATALVAGETQLTFQELDRKSNWLAHRLRARGADAEVPIAICTERTADMVVGILGILKAGGAYVPLDPSYPAERLWYILDDVRAPLLLTSRHLAAELPVDDAQVVCVDADWPDVEGGAEVEVPPTSRSAPGNIAYIIYTSGSTGYPKGVAMTHANATSLLLWAEGVFDEDDRRGLLASTSMCFDLSVFELFLPLCFGGTVILAENALELPTLQARDEVTLINTVPSAISELLRQDAVPATVGTVCLAGEPLVPEVVDRLYDVGVKRVFDLYGPSEDTTYSTFTLRERGGPATIGRPIANEQAYILDRGLRPVPIGVTGELYLGGRGVARGYIDRPDLTAERFVPDPFVGEPGARLYRTGDLARYRADGNIEFLGRADHQVKLRGYRIEPGEIEAALLDSENVREAVVVGRADVSRGKQLIAYIVSAPGHELSRSALRERLAERVPAYMIPSTIVFLDAMPLTPNGKVDRRALPEPSAQRQAEGAFVAPRSDVEARIAAIWREVLGVDRIGSYDNFFELGGESLLLVQVHARLVDRLDRDFSLVDLFQYPTVASLARFLCDDEAANQSYLRTARARLAGHAGEEAPGDQRAVAIIGMAGRFPGAATVEQFWDNLCGGVESISFLGEAELRGAGIDETVFRDPGYVPAKGILAEADCFDAAFFGYSPREAEIVDPQQRVILECAWSALEAAGYDPEQYGGRIGVYAGSSPNTYVRRLRADSAIMASIDPMTLSHGNEADFVATRIAYKLNLRGPAVNVQTACSTSLVAVHEACKSLLAGECSMALAGGVHVTAPLHAGYMHQEGSIMSCDGHCRTFDADASGTVGGDGVGIVVLKWLADAVADGDRIHAVILGSAMNNDGAMKVGFTAPSVEGQAEAIAGALCAADVDPATIGYVEAHGTATELGDPIEVAVLSQVFSETTDRRQYCALGALKTNVGHMDAAAGVGGLIKSALVVEHGKIPPSLHYRTPNPKIDIANSPFFVNTVLRDWESEGHPRRAGVTSLGIGGTNVHAVLEQAPVPAPSGPARDWQLLMLSAKNLTALEQQAANLAAHLRAHPDVSLADVAHTLQVGRAEFEHRRAVAARSTSEAAALLDGADPAAIVTRRAARVAHPVVFMFPGQGAQYVDMGRGLYESERVYREVVDQSLALLRDEMGLDLCPLLYPGGDAPPDTVEPLKRTEIAQPALFVVEYALAELWRSWGVEPEACIGHSIGEYVAAVVGGVLRWEDALRLVALRGRLMGEMPAGVMSAVPLPTARVRELLASETDLWLSVVNAPSMCVVSGAAERVAAFEAQLQERDGIECRRLHTSHAFHSGLMDGAVQPFVEAVREVPRHAPGIPYVSNVTGTWITEEDVLDASYWGRHIRHAVLFSEGLDHLLENPNRVLLEVGPGEVLGALARRQPGLGAERVVVPSLRGPISNESSEADAAFLTRALGRLWTGGVAVDWTRYRDGERRRRVTLPTYPFQRKRFWIDRRQSSASPTHTSLDKWFHVPAWRRTSPPAALEGPDAPACLVFVDASPLSAQVVDALRRAGCDVTIVESGPAFAEKGGGYVIAPATPEDYERLLRHVIAAGPAPDRVVHLWNAAPDEDWLADDAARDRVDQGFYSVLYLARALGGANDLGPVHVDVVTTGVHEVTGQETVQPEKALLLGPGRVIGQEFSDVTCRMIDLAAEEVDGASACLMREILSSADETLVAYRRGRRYLETFARVPLAKPSGLPRPLRKGGTYLITGGLGGIGLELAKDLARTASANVVLTSRTVLPARDAWAEHLERHGEDDTVSRRIRAVEAMEQAGGNVMVAAADVADADAMRAIVAEAERRFGAVHGVVHAAGVAGGGVILLKDRDEAERVLRPKVAGARVLHQLFAERELDFMALCSSVTAVLGNAGQVDYCGANAYLDAFARRFGAETGVFTVSIGWNRWSEVGMAVDTALGLGHGRALTGASNAEGVEAFRRILDAGAEPHVVVYERDLTERMTADAELVPDLAAGAGDAPTAIHGRPDIGVSYVAPCTDTERVLAEIWQRLLGIEQIGIHDNFFELGGDSVLNLQIVRQAKQAGLAITPKAVFDHQTVAALAAATGRADAPAEVPTGSDNTTDAQDNANGEPGADQPGRLSAASLSERDLAAIARQLGRGSDAD